ncbi:MAG: hypothetical protein NTX33_10850 [Propionibacteriales bacterium]|nr:hypothetical protein [Propionibacteriales bacterium]
MSALGLPNFRAFLGAAQLQGIVHVHKPAGATDVVISSGPPDSAGFGGGAPDRGEDQPPVSRPPLASAVASKGRWLRADLWRALTDFSDTRYAYSPRTRTTFAIDPDPGTAAALGGGDSLDLPAMTGEEQKRWVSAFVTTCAPVGQRERLHELAETAEGVRAFTDEALTTPEVRRRWGRFLREHTTARAQTWAEEQSIPFSDLLDPVRPDPRPVAVATPEPAAPEVAPRTAEEELRSEILAVLSRLSLEELLVLRIPAKYALLR